MTHDKLLIRTALLLTLGLAIPSVVVAQTAAAPAAPAKVAPATAPAPVANTAAKPVAAPAPAALKPAVPASAGGASSADRGKALFSEKVCSSCHSLDGTQIIGPSLKGVFGSSVELLDGSKVTADDNYMKESILDSQAKIVKGFAAGVMPAYKGQLTDAQVADLAEYIKTLK